MSDCSVAHDVYGNAALNQLDCPLPYTGSVVDVWMIAFIALALLVLGYALRRATR